MATPDSTDPRSLGQTIKEKKNVLIGAAVLVVLIFVVVSFVQRQQAEKRYEPWRQLAGETDPRFPLSLEPDELAARAASIEDPTVAGIAAFMEAVKVYDEAKGDTEQLASALQKLDSFRENFKDHPLMTQPFPTGDPALGAVPPAMAIAARMTAAADIGGRFPAPKQNAARPPAGNTVTLVTDKGEVVIDMYTDLSPESCAAFRDHAESLKGTFIISAIEESYIDLGLDADASPLDLEGVESDFPPYEMNGLSLFKGTVTFRQRPFTEGPYSASLKVWLADNFRQDGSYTVIGQVSSGLELLEEMAASEKSADVASQLAEPVEITDARVELPGLDEKSSDGENDTEAGDDSEEASGSDGGPR